MSATKTGRHEAPRAADDEADIEPSEAALDEGVEESFPASDPVSVSVTKKQK